MQRFADWTPFEVKPDDSTSSCRIGYRIRCAACGRTLSIAALQYKGDLLRTYFALSPEWRRNAIGMWHRSKRAPRRKFEYTLPDGSNMFARLNQHIENTAEFPDAIPFLIECDGKTLVDGRYMPCKERNIVDPFSGDTFVVREELVSA